jgi:hypothetical protein
VVTEVRDEADRLAAEMTEALDRLDQAYQILWCVNGITTTILWTDRTWLEETRDFLQRHKLLSQLEVRPSTGDSDQVTEVVTSDKDCHSGKSMPSAGDSDQ